MIDAALDGVASWVVKKGDSMRMMSGALGSRDLLQRSSLDDMEDPNLDEQLVMLVETQE